MIDDIDKKNKEITRRDFVILTASSMAALGIASFLWPAIDSLNPSADVLALSSIEVDLSPIKPGQSITVKWRGRPVFIRHRTEEEIKEAQMTDIKSLIDPEEDKNRVKTGKEKWIIMVGICTHLGCVPLGNQGDYNGWFCPCHGSHYDISGRIRKGPAPKNMAIPEYSFLNDTHIKIG